MLCFLIFCLGGAPFEASGEFLLENSVNLVPPLYLASNERQLLVMCEGLNDIWFHIYNHQGKRLTSFGSHGKGPEEIQVMGFPSWIPWDEAFYIYDLYAKVFKIWGYDGVFRNKKIALNKNVFLKKYGKVFPLLNETLVLVLDNDDPKWHLAKYDRDFNFIGNGFPIEDPRVGYFNDFVHTVEVETFNRNGEIRIAALENLTPLVHIFDEDLKLIRRFPVFHPAWREVDLKKIQRLKLKNPTTWYRSDFKDDYSEICALHVISDELLVIGYRNLKPDLYVYQCFDLTGKKIGDALETKLILKGRIGDRLLFLDEDADTIKLTEYRIKR